MIGDALTVEVVVPARVMARIKLGLWIMGIGARVTGCSKIKVRTVPAKRKPRATRATKES